MIKPSLQRAINKFSHASHKCPQNLLKLHMETFIKLHFIIPIFQYAYKPQGTRVVNLYTTLWSTPFPVLSMITLP
jgi:hypothetical protein